VEGEFGVGFRGGDEAGQVRPADVGEELAEVAADEGVPGLAPLVQTGLANSSTVRALPAAGEPPGPGEPLGAGHVDGIERDAVVVAVRGVAGWHVGSVGTGARSVPRIMVSRFVAPDWWPSDQARRSPTREARAIRATPWRRGLAGVARIALASRVGLRRTGPSTYQSAATDR